MTFAEQLLTMGSWAFLFVVAMGLLGNIGNIVKSKDDPEENRKVAVRFLIWIALGTVAVAAVRTWG